MNGQEIEVAAAQLFETPRQCHKCRKWNRTPKVKGREFMVGAPKAMHHSTVNPVLVNQSMVWGCDRCYPVLDEQKTGKATFAELGGSLFNDETETFSL